MPFTRRRILRDAVCVSAAAAASSFPLFAADHGGHKPNYLPPSWNTANNPSQFQSGIRVFFIGAWLFFGELDGTGILAATRDMAGMSHTFPYGVWSSGLGNSLGENPSASQTRNAYPITLPGFKSSYQSAQQLFNNCASNDSFNYIEANNNDLSLNYALPQIRVISLPYPSRIFPVDIIMGATVDDKDSHSWISNLFAAGHVFEYWASDGASTLSFNLEQQITQPSTASDANFHIHTVPPKGAPNGHTQMMFSNLMTVVSGLDGTKFSLTLDQNATEYGGPYIPANVAANELGMQGRPPAKASAATFRTFIQHPFMGDTAGCASVGGGIGGH